MVANGLASQYKMICCIPDVASSTFIICTVIVPVQCGASDVKIENKRSRIHDDAFLSSDIIKLP